MQAARPHTGTRDDALVGAARRVVPWLVLAFIIFTVVGMFSNYRRSQAAWDTAHEKPTAAQAAAEASAAKKPGSKAPAKPPAGVAKLTKVVVVSEVTFRKEASTASGAIRDLKQDEQLTLVGQAESWYKVTDSKGVVGWVSSSPKFTKLVK